jgi:hypothetical protein
VVGHFHIVVLNCLGTKIANAVLVDIDTQSYHFIGTPGFGHAYCQYDVVKESIHKLLGYFTRILGGIHGIPHIQGIRDERVSTRMRDSLKFIKELTEDKERYIYSHITFITTKWDVVAQKKRANCDNQENELKTRWCNEFNLDEPKGA